MRNIKSKKGMALAGTLILMTIVLMLSLLLMSLLIFGSQVASVNMQDVENRVVLDEIGNRFIRNSNAPDKVLKHYVDKYNLKYYDAADNVSDDPTDVIKGNIEKLKVVISIKENTSGTERVLKVSTINRDRQLLKVVCALDKDIITGEATATFKTWNYGKKD